jgi:paraquat-inducible protein A
MEQTDYIKNMHTILAQSENPQNLTACHACDLLLPVPQVAPGSRARCPRCGTVIAAPKINTVDRSLALVLSGLLLFVPAVTLPILSMTILGKTSSNTLIGGVLSIYNEGFYWVSLLVLCFSIIAPLLKFATLTTVLLQVKLHVNTGYLAGLFRFSGYLDSWAMIDVYMISLLVAVVKLFEIASITSGLGLYCFIGMLLVSTLATTTLDRDAVWDAIGEMQR